MSYRSLIENNNFPHRFQTNFTVIDPVLSTGTAEYFIVYAAIIVISTFAMGNVCGNRAVFPKLVLSTNVATNRIQCKPIAGRTAPMKFQ